MPAPDDLSHVAVVVAAPQMELGIEICAKFKMSSIEQRIRPFEGGHLELVHHVGVEVLRDLRSIEVAARY